MNESIKRFLAISLFASAFFFMAVITAASAHEWYDRDCCSKKDCAPIVSIKRIQINPVNAEVLVTNELGIKGYIKKGYTQYRQSKDGKDHACIPSGYDEFSGSQPAAPSVVMCIYTQLKY